MEVRLQAQEDEITLLKSSLADALRKLRLHDQQMLLLKQHLIAGGELHSMKHFLEEAPALVGTLHVFTSIF